MMNDTRSKAVPVNTCREDRVTFAVVGLSFRSEANLFFTGSSGGRLMIANRFGEDGHPPFRSRRLFSENGEWYFDTREGAKIGPYHDLKSVKNALAVFIAQRLLVMERSTAGDFSFTAGAQEGIEHLVEELHTFYNLYKTKGQAAAVVWGNQRLRELMRDSADDSGNEGRMDAIRYVLSLDEG